MDCKQFENNIPDYVDGGLAEAEKQRFKAHLQSCASCRAELQTQQKFMALFGQVPQETPSDRLRDGFLDMLAEEQQAQVVHMAPKKEFPWKTAFQIAASIALVMGGFFLGGLRSGDASQEQISALQQESKVLKQQMMLALMENRSPSKRIQAVNYTEEIAQPDATLIKALADRLLYDANGNVRLAAAEALGNFKSSQQARAALIEALNTEKDPSLQIELIGILVRLQEKRALEPMKKLLETQETPIYVKEQLNNGITQLI
jgi:anti-sigma factor RsiW